MAVSAGGELAAAEVLEVETSVWAGDEDALAGADAVFCQVQAMEEDPASAERAPPPRRVPFWDLNRSDDDDDSDDDEYCYEAVAEPLAAQEQAGAGEGQEEWEVGATTAAEDAKDAEDAEPGDASRASSASTSSVGTADDGEASGLMAAAAEVLDTHGGASHEPEPLTSAEADETANHEERKDEEDEEDDVDDEL